MTMQLICKGAETVEDRWFCARRFGVNYGIHGATEDDCRVSMVKYLGREWKWLRLLGWQVGSFTVPRTVWHLAWQEGQCQSEFALSPQQ